MELKLEDKIMDISCMVEQLGTTAWAAASASFCPEKSEKILDAVLYSIKSLSERIVMELDALADETASEDVDAWQEELCNIFKRLDFVGRSEVLVYASKVEKKALERET